MKTITTTTAAAMLIGALISPVLFAQTIAPTANKPENAETANQDPMHPDQRHAEDHAALPTEPMGSDVMNRPPMQTDTMQADTMQAEKMRTQMRDMQTQMKTIQTTSDSSERQRLMREHGMAMQENMRAIRAMDSTSMQTGMAGKPMTPAQQANYHAASVQRMDMLDTMMEQMLQHEKAMASMPKP